MLLRSFKLRIDILILLSKSDHLDPYRMCKLLGITYRACYSHLRILEKAGLTGGKIMYHITDKGRRILSRLDEMDGAVKSLRKTVPAS